MYDNTRVIGDIGEAFALAKFTQYGCKVSIPFTENAPYDLIVDYNGKLYKIQVKTTKNIKNGVMEFYLTRTNGFTFVNTKYNEKEADYFFLYCIENNWCGLIKISEDLPSIITIRIDYPKNNDLSRCRFANDYEFNRRIDELKTDNNILTLPYQSIKKPTKQKKETVIVNEIPYMTNRNKLKNEIRQNPLIRVAEIYGVSDNTIRRWCEKMGLPSHSKDIRKYSDDEWELI